MIESFLKELQALDEDTKRKVMVVATIVLMIGVVYVWLGYFNGLVASTQATENPTAAQTSDTPGIPDAPQQSISMFASIGNYFVGAMQGIAHAFQSPGQYTIQPSQQPIQQQASQ